MRTATDLLGTELFPKTPLPRLTSLLLETTKMANGTVKWFNTTKGFGFIKPEDGGNDVFVHISALERAGLSGLEDNQPVSYELVEDRRGRMSAGELKLR